MRKGQLRSMVADKQKNFWKEAMVEGTRLEFLSLVKKEFVFEQYLSYGVRKVRYAVARFRISDHNLQVERDRWRPRAEAIPCEMRLCVHCDAGKVEDEMHIFSCDKYGLLRQRYGVTCTTAPEVQTALNEARPNMLWFIYHVLREVDAHCASTQTPTQTH